MLVTKQLMVAIDFHSIFSIGVNGCRNDRIFIFGWTFPLRKSSTKNENSAIDIF